MEIQLSAEALSFIESQVREGLYGSASEVIEALVQEKQGSQPASAPPSQAARQRQKILQVIEECASLSPAVPGNQFSNREHDRVLYGERK
jgi:putative addiction module CopG family antidote